MSDFPRDHEPWMRRALELADQAAARGEVPVGAVVVDSAGVVLGQGFNQRENENDPTAHAEILALRQAAKQRQSWRLNDTTLYVTLEPCAMCAGALVNARVSELVYGCADPKAGAVHSLYSICEDPRLNHRLTVTSGIIADVCAARLSTFFAALRA